MTEHSNEAKRLFCNGYNCCQAVLLAFSDITGLDEKTALTIASSFGGGMGRLREVCGAVSGMFMVAGILYGYSDMSERSAKAEHYALIQRMASMFKEKNGSIVCRELLGAETRVKSHIPDERTEAYYKKRPCAELCADAAEIMDIIISEKGLSK